MKKLEFLDKNKMLLLKKNFYILKFKVDRRQSERYTEGQDILRLTVLTRD